MSHAFDSIKQGLNEAIAHAKSKGRKSAGVTLYQPQAVDVSSLRERLSLTQEQFAARFGFSVAIGIGRSLTAPPSHTTGHTGHVSGGSLKLR